jgi:hypothetical protein
MLAFAFGALRPLIDVIGHRRAGMNHQRGFLSVSLAPPSFASIDHGVFLYGI